MRQFVQEVYIVCINMFNQTILYVSTYTQNISSAEVTHNTKLFKRYGIPFAQVECIQLQRPAILQNILHCTTANQAGKSHARPTNAHHLRPFRSTVRWLKWMHLRWSWCTLYLLVCHVRATVGDSGLCC